MSTVKVNAAQIGQSVTATNNFVWYQPASPDGTVRLGNGNSGSVTDLVTVGTTGNLTFANSVSLSAASTKTLTLNGGAGSNGLVLDASNNVGIGTGTPYALLNPNTSSRNSTALWLSAPLYNNGGLSVDSYVEMKLGNSYIGLNSIGQSAIRSYANVWSSSASDLTFHTSTSAGTLTERMRLDSSGNLGLGVTPSTSWQSTRRILQVGGSAALWATSGSAGTLFLSNNTYYDGTNFRYLNTSGASYLAQQTDGSYSFNQAASGTAGNAITFNQAMTLSANGELLVGSTNTLGSCKVNVLFTNGTNNGLSVYDVATSGTASMVLFYRGGSQVGSITSTSSTTAFNPSSDISLKENIKPITNGLERVSKLKPVDYNWKTDGVLDNGFIAQDLLATEEFAHRCNAIETKEDGTKVYGVDYMKFVAVLTAAIQELSAEIEILKQKVN